MPYINQDRREQIFKKKIHDTYVSHQIEVDNVTTAGELNYAVTELIKAFYFNGKPGYERINAIVGALEGAKLEFYRRIATQYEEEKIKENGDVYPETKNN